MRFRPWTRRRPTAARPGAQKGRKYSDFFFSRERREACKTAGLPLRFQECLQSTNTEYLPGAVLGPGMPQRTRQTKSPACVGLARGVRGSACLPPSRTWCSGVSLQRGRGPLRDLDLHSRCPPGAHGLLVTRNDPQHVEFLFVGGAPRPHPPCPGCVSSKGQMQAPEVEASRSES